MYRVVIEEHYEVDVKAADETSFRGPLGVVLHPSNTVREPRTRTILIQEFEYIDVRKVIKVINGIE